MAAILKSLFPVSSSKKEDNHEEFDVEYSFAEEYSGPPVSYDIPQVVPVDVHRIPTASVVATAAMLSRNLSLPVIEPIVKSDSKLIKNQKSKETDLESEYVENDHAYRGLDGIESSGTLGFSDSHDNSRELSGSSDVEDLVDECKEEVRFVSHPNSVALESEESILSSPDVALEVLSCEEAEDYADEIVGNQGCRNVVTFCETQSSDVSTDSDEEEPGMFPEKPIVSSDSKKCFRCHKGKRFNEREVCVACGAKYCIDCVLRAMGAMPEGRKCITCIGYRINESKRNSLGKCSAMLKRLLSKWQIDEIMELEKLCQANQLPPHLVSVNGKRLSLRELFDLQSCAYPPKKLRPGKYWYDKVSGLWGKEGHKPCQIISPQLAVGDIIKKDASKGNTNIVINNREITQLELYMLKLAGINCEGNVCFWLSADGSCQEEGMNNVVGKIWDKTTHKLLCHALRLPIPPVSTNSSGEEVGSGLDAGDPCSTVSKKLNKLLLAGCDQSGTSTLFKQAKIAYHVPFSEEEHQNITYTIQRNLYRYIAILLEGRERFEEEYRVEMRKKRLDEPGPSALPDLIEEEIEEENVYSISPRLKNFSDWLLQAMMLGNLEVIFPAATREYSAVVEELWKHKAFQATYQRRNELEMLPRVANYFLDHAVEISKVDYNPSDMDKLYAEGITSSNGVASMEFSFPNPTQDSYMETVDQHSSSMKYQLIRVHASCIGKNCKWLEMFEDVDLVIFCVSLTEYSEYLEDYNGFCTNKMMESKRLFENIVSHPAFAQKHCLLLLNKFDILEEIIEEFPLSECEWFQDFNPVISRHPNSKTNNNNPSLAQRAYHYIAVKFKRLYNSITERKLFVSQLTALEAESVDGALKYTREILKWDEERRKVMRDWTTESPEASTTLEASTTT
ncbi:extra-large guanine nucleotide-binding protein 1-like [Solanum pennellii]|uniref:Extra-large guanine nucleotide-binding protein 1-like n=1 Tax=Solanum pennellii TaxID=28526 RepID=A0ABM1VH56_SOLPN|nr:extra-large guanine nucleotide-binding protein 1-like [Solanum pennellii]XP_027775074.1 extra-large guanine nucleotide-binding protein 1-like [Solanum pennellii]